MRYNEFHHRWEISPSSLLSRMTCAHAHWLRYHDKVNGVSSLKMARGTAFHKGMEHYWRERMNGVEDGPGVVAEAIEAAISKFHALLESELKAPDVAPTEEDATNSTLWLCFAVKGYCAKFGAMYRPLAVEERIQEDLFPGVWSNGFVDLIAERLSDGARAIIDFKTRTKRSKEPSEREIIQALMYGEADAIEIHEVIYRDVTKTRREPEADFQILPVEIEDREFEMERLRCMIEEHLKAYHSGAHPPCIVSQFGCNGCSQRYECQYWRM